MGPPVNSNKTPPRARIAVFLLACALAPCCPAAYPDTVGQSRREIPVAAEVDVVVVGGTIGAVAAAVEAAEAGASVMLIAPRTYLGEDICGTLRLWLEDDETPGGELTKRIFADRRATTPMRVKKALETALLKRDVRFLFGSYASDVLIDQEERLTGIVMANRSGRQAVPARVIIDATGRGTVAKMAGAVRYPWKAGKHICRRVVLGGESTSVAKEAREISAGVDFSERPLHYVEYTLELDLGDGTFGAIAAAENRARGLTYREGQLRAAERMTFLPPDRVRGRASAAAWKQGQPWAIGHFRAASINRLYVLGPAADIPRSAAEQIMRPTVAESLGKAVGRAAADEAKQASSYLTVGTRGPIERPVCPGDVCEVLGDLQSGAPNCEEVGSPQQSMPVLAKVDVLVVGGGTSGACAAIGAARRGADVLVAEYQEGLGGVGTVGLIGRAYHGQNRGFTREVPFCDSRRNNEYKMEWFRREIRKAGGRIWLGTLGCGAFAENDRVRGAVVVTPQGRGVVLADVVIDATGNADVAVAAGAKSMYGADANQIALQGTGLPTRPLGGTYVNTDYLLVDESDVVDTWRALVGARLATTSNAYDMGSFIQTRERRRVLGDHILSYLDQIAERTYADSIVLSGSDYDSHGYPSEPFFALIPHTAKTLKANHPAPGGTCYTPYRCLLPRGIEGMLVTGLAVSMHRDASAMVRMQRDMHNQGYAAGVAAAMAVARQCTPRQIDVKALQKHLVEIGNLPESVLSDADSFPLSRKAIGWAVAHVAEVKQTRTARCKALAMILSHQAAARPLLREAFDSARGDVRLEYAKMLGFLGDRDAVPLLAEALEQVDAWDAKIYQGNMAEYAHLPTPVDALILALGYTRDRRATSAILAKLDMLDAGVTLSHHRAVALALEQLADPQAAEPLARLLGKPGMRGHAMRELEPLHDRDREKRRRMGPLREIVLARALYRCGDHGGLGEKILGEYRHDLRGLFARHATAVLGDGQVP